MVGFRDNGQRKYRSFYGQTQKEVRAKLRKYQEELAEGLDTDKLWGFSEWADFWYEQHKDNIAPTTQETYKYTLRILKEHPVILPVERNYLIETNYSQYVHAHHAEDLVEAVVGGRVADAARLPRAAVEAVAAVRAVEPRLEHLAVGAAKQFP